LQRAVANLLVEPILGQRTHVAEVRGLNPSTPGNSVCRSEEPVDNLPPHSSVANAGSVPADRPIEEDDLLVHGKGGLYLGGQDATFQVLKVRIA